MTKMTLSEARATNKLEQFIAESESEGRPPGDEAKLNRALASMARTSKEAPAALKPDRSGD